MADQGCLRRQRQRQCAGAPAKLGKEKKKTRSLRRPNLYYIYESAMK